MWRLKKKGSLKSFRTDSVHLCTALTSRLKKRGNNYVHPGFKEAQHRTEEMQHENSKVAPKLYTVKSLG
jgi:hypothetical protein